MQFHGLMLVRDEEDILPQCLKSLLSWIDWLYVLDLGSTDATWEIVNDMAAKDPRIIPFKSQPIIYNDNLRCVLFREYRKRFKEGDWVMKIDADEFYHVPPPQFVREHLHWADTCVYLAWYFFRLTNLEVAAYDDGSVSIEADRKRPIEERRRHYKIADYAEPRMFRYRRTMQWPENASFPINAGYTARERIPIRHYPHRDNLQMQRRYELREAMTRLKVDAAVPHWKLADWRQDVIDVLPTGGSRERDDSVGLGVSQGHTSGDLSVWLPGTELPEIRTFPHIKPGLKRFVQRLIHPTLLPLIDPWRSPISPSYEPDPIPEEVTRMLLCSRNPG